jgi:hypothetical protein
MSIHRKTIFPSEWYHFKITQVNETDEKITLTFTCDVGDRAYQHIVMEFNRITQAHLLERMCDGLGFVPVGNPTDDYYSLQFVGIRTRALTSIISKEFGTDVFLTNIIVEWKPETRPPDWNVSKPKSDDYFFTQKNKKKLPV